MTPDSSVVYEGSKSEIEAGLVEASIRGMSAHSAGFTIVPAANHWWANEMPIVHVGRARHLAHRRALDMLLGNTLQFLFELSLNFRNRIMPWESDVARAPQANPTRKKQGSYPVRGEAAKSYTVFTASK